ncbi:c-type cytochrome domain-containing protein [Tamlana sp. 2201CG12-4]|uniref:c-type cytochrome domain-containing protein n=1 Tax=Tamlana sp. 2201CG12-4 TaxID=3112582 RepID=UPI002DB775FB|nr:c-type cytochrome domain-containing protein [Tamlana sp. 2201CG12-4]MEC3906653.1 c-type cytochrome domain-containing protein [Tamlana sp. 2201CG12-4]
MIFFLETNVYQFFGRFHAIIVHLPIGFIVLAVLFELISLKKKTDLNLAISYAYLVGALSGVFSIILGLMLASDGDYNETTLNIHKWTGITMTIVAFLLFFIKRKQEALFWARKSYPVLVTLVVALLFVAGHNGGSLTHGSDYLFEHAPNPIRTLAGMKPVRERVIDLDSALVYEDVIHPIFESKCNVCHSNDKAKGDLLLTDAESIMNGGESGAVIVGGNAKESELYRRITLSPTHKEFMPTEGRTPLSKEETMLIQWWIDEGASFDKKVVELNISDRMMICLKDVGIGLEKTFIERLDLKAVEDNVIAAIEAQGFKIKPITGNSTLLEVAYSPYRKDSITSEKIEVLLQARTNIVWLDFSSLNLQVDLIAKLGQLENLVELRMSNTNLTDVGMKAIESLTHLEYLNLYGNPISDVSLESLNKLSSLQKLYLWKTNISEEGLKNIKDHLQEVTVISGI